MTQGEHAIEFRFQPPLTTFYISLCGLLAAILIAGFVTLSNRSARALPEVAETEKVAKV